MHATNLPAAPRPFPLLCISLGGASSYSPHSPPLFFLTDGVENFGSSPVCVLVTYGILFSPSPGPNTLSLEGVELCM